MEPSTARPCLKIVGLQVEAFRALRRVDWPADGTGWGGTVPDIVVVGGVNGSGKTTLLELIANAAQGISDTMGPLPEPRTMRVRIDFRVSMGTVSDARLTVLWGDPEFMDKRPVDAPIAPQVRAGGILLGDPLIFNEARQAAKNASWFARSDLPSVIYLPTDRKLTTPPEAYKAAGKLSEPKEFFYRFEPASRWQDSLEALLYSARWADLNAKEEGHPERATHFESYAKAFQGFFGDAKHLIWEGGELFVKIADTGALHPLMELSSGEKQALILAAELYRRWRPGSLILIDEPELHFHPSWQTALYTMLERWQKERGGQVILATQSTHLFRLAAPGTTVLLGGPLA